MGAGELAVLSVVGHISIQRVGVVPVVFPSQSGGGQSLRLIHSFLWVWGGATLTVSTASRWARGCGAMQRCGH